MAIIDWSFFVISYMQWFYSAGPIESSPLLARLNTSPDVLPVVVVCQDTNTLMKNSNLPYTEKDRIRISVTMKVL